MNSLKNSLKKYVFIGLISAKSNLAYFGEAVGRIIFLGVILYIFLRLWEVTYHQSGALQLGGFSISQMLWYLVVTESIMLSNPRVAYNVDTDVRTGALAVHLLRPMSYPLQTLFSTLGERAVRFAVNFMVGTFIALVFVGPIQVSMQGLTIFLISLPFAFVLDFLGYFLIGLGAFWIEDTTGFVFLYSRICMVLGGMILPLDLFPESWKSILKPLPFSSIVYGPAHLFVKPDFHELIDLVLRQSVAIVAYFIVVCLVWRMATRRIFANGG